MDTSVVHNVEGNIYNMYVHFTDFETIYNKFTTIAGLSFKSSKTDRHGVTEILLKVALTTINLKPKYLQ
jgi:hypothetical protein